MRATRSKFHWRFKIAAVAAFYAVLAAAYGAEGKLSAAVSSDRIFLGDAFTLEVSLDGAPSSGVVPVLANTEKCDISSPQPRTQSSRSISMLNGKRTETVVEQTSWIYSVVPQEAGRFSIGEAQVTVGGRKLTTKVPDVLVTSAEPQPYVKIEVAANRESVLLDEPFEISVNVKVVKLDGENAAANPIPDANQAPPLLEIPFFSESGVGGCSFSMVLNDFLSPLMQPRGQGAGFRINDYTVTSQPSMFAILDPRRPAVFYFEREESELGGKPAWNYRIAIPFKATQEGTCRFPSVRFKGAVFAKREGSDKIEPISVFAVSDPIQVNVTPPPEVGRPKSFIGSLGTRMEAVATLDAQACNEGDPLLLNLDISGDLTFSNMKEPRLFENAAMAERFRHYGEIRSEKTAFGMRYSYKLRPIISGTIEVPALELSFYNTETRAYETIKTSPVPLRVNPAQQLDPDAIYGVSTNSARASLLVKDERVPSALTMSLRGIRKPVGVNRNAALAVLVMPPSVYAMVAVLTAVWRRRKSLGNAVKRNSATGRSVRGILHARTPQDVMDAVGVMLRDRMGVSGSGFTPGDVHAILLGRGVDTATADEIARLLQEVFDSGFSPDADPVKMVKSHRGRIAELLAAVRVSVLLFMVLGTAWGASAADEDASSFIWRQAAATASTAKAPEDFRKAAMVYRSLIENGALNGDALFNYGTMLMLAGHPKEAVDAFKRAEALDGASPELENNLEIAWRDLHRPSTPDKETWRSADSASGLPWYRVPLFWHYRVPVQVRINALAVMWCVLWVGLLVRRFGLKTVGKIIVLASVVGMAVFGSSVLASRRVLSGPLPDVIAVEATAERTVGS